MVNWTNPYKHLSDSWFKGSLHCHCAPQSPCARTPLERVLELYENSGFDFISISNHQQTTTVEINTKMTIIPGIEWNSRKKGQPTITVNYTDHLGIYSTTNDKIRTAPEKTTLDEVTKLVRTDETLIILNHPNWLVPHHYSEKDLFKLHWAADGIEIYNNVINRNQGSADATMKWDRLLTDQGPTLGFASDDSHFEEDINHAYLFVNARENTISEIFSNIKAGKFYCSTGVEFQAIGRTENVLFCTAEGAYIEAVGENGRIVDSAQNKLQVNMEDSLSSYLRFVSYGQAKEQAWSQPFFKEPPPL